MPIPYNNIKTRLETLKDYCTKWSEIFIGRTKNVSNFHVSKMLDAFKDSIISLEKELDLAGGSGGDDPKSKNLPKYEQTQMMYLIEKDWDIISRICIQRLFLPNKRTPVETSDTSEQVVPKKKGHITKLLQHADQQALDFYHAFDGFRTNAIPLVLFDKAFHIIRYKLTPYPLIGVPFSFRDRDMQPQAIAHEVGHYIYSHSNDPHQKIKASTMLSGLIPDIIGTWYDENEIETGDDGDEIETKYNADVHAFRKSLLTEMIREWLEEIMADIFGALLSGPSYIDTSINMAITKSMADDDNVRLDTKYLRKDDSSHPAPYLRPFIATKVLEWVSNFLKDKQSSKNFDAFVADRKKYWQESTSTILSIDFNLASSVQKRESYQQKNDETDSKNGLVPSSLITSAISAIDYLVEVILEGFKPKGRTAASTWHKKGDNTGIFGIGHLIKEESLKALFETVKANENEERPDYTSFPAKVSERFTYSAGIPAHQFVVMEKEEEVNGLQALIDFAREKLGLGMEEKSSELTRMLLDLIKSNQAFLQEAELLNDTIRFILAEDGKYVLIRNDANILIAKLASDYKLPVTEKYDIYQAP